MLSGVGEVERVNGSSDVTDDDNDEAANNVGVVGLVASRPPTYAAAFTAVSAAPDEVDPSGWRRITIRTACPDAKAPIIPTTPAASKRPPDSRRDRT